MSKDKYIPIPWSIFLVAIVLLFANMIRNNHQRELDRELDRELQLKKMDNDNLQREKDRELQRKENEKNRELQRKLSEKNQNEEDSGIATEDEGDLPNSILKNDPLRE